MRRRVDDVLAVVIVQIESTCMKKLRGKASDVLSRVWSWPGGRDQRPEIETTRRNARLQTNQASLRSYIGAKSSPALLALVPRRSSREGRRPRFISLFWEKESRAEIVEG